MSRSDWLQFGLSWSLGLAVLAATIVLLDRYVANAAPISPRPPGPLRRLWRTIPEVRLVLLALPLEALWEIAQFPLYDVGRTGDWRYTLYALAHCTVGDVLILLLSYELVALLRWNRHWLNARVLAPASSFVLFGVAYTVFSEIYNVRIVASWSYGERMPMVPMIGVGAMPLLQWLLLPPVLLWLLWLIAPRIAAERHAVD